MTHENRPRRTVRPDAIVPAQPAPPHAITPANLKRALPAAAAAVTTAAVVTVGRRLLTALVRRAASALQETPAPPQDQTAPEAQAAPEERALTPAPRGRLLYRRVTIIETVELWRREE